MNLALTIFWNKYFALKEAFRFGDESNSTNVCNLTFNVGSITKYVGSVLNTYLKINYRK